MESSNASTSATEENASQAMSCAVARPQATDSDVYLCVVSVLIKYKGKGLRTYAFLDQGSTHTFCEQRLLDALQAEGPQSEMSFQTLNDVTR